MNTLFSPLLADRSPALIQWLRETVRRWRRRAEARATARALSELEPYLLRDLGLDRSEAESVAWELQGLAQVQRRAAWHALASRGA